MLLFLGILSFGLTYLIRFVAIKRNVIDIPNERSSHTQPTPRGGGLAIVICWFLGLVYLFIQGEIEDKLFYALLSGIILAIIGVLDDIYSLQPKVRLTAQAFTAILAIYFLNGFNLQILTNQGELVTVTISIIAVIGIIWFINLYNFLDGIDAYASLEGIFIALSIYFLTGGSYLLVLVASILGFLIWNWPKAKIFMGDVGSTQLGFILIVIGIHLHNSQQLNITAWLILASLFWFDASLTLFRRWKNKEKLSQAHKKHAYQRSVQAGFSHLKTDIFALILNILLFILAFGALKTPEFQFLFLIVAILLLFFVVLRIDKIFPFEN